MANPIKDRNAILAKLGIGQLNQMQEQSIKVIQNSEEIVLTAPTGSGKTIAFLLPIVENLIPDILEVQTLIIVPSRELAIQIEQVARNMGTGYKITAIYGGRPVSKDKLELKHRPAILIGTPGRIADHIRRATFKTTEIRTLVLDEFDKSLEVGFEKEMQEIVCNLTSIKKTILTSATPEIEIPTFMEVKNPSIVNSLDDNIPNLEIRIIESPTKDKLETLFDTLCHIGDASGIIFCNFKESIERVSAFLESRSITHGCYFGSLDQKEREHALVKFRNGTHRILLATDLASRGLDIPEIKFIIHYHIPPREQEYIHRNGRTARMLREGTVFIIKSKGEVLPIFISDTKVESLVSASIPPESRWKTLFISGGRRDKISKSDIAGLFQKKGKLTAGDLGKIELKQDCALVAVASERIDRVISLVNNSKLKKKKIRVYLI